MRWHEKKFGRKQQLESETTTALWLARTMRSYNAQTTVEKLKGNHHVNIRRNH